MTTEFTDELLKILLRTALGDPLEELEDSHGWLRLRTFSISKNRPVWNDGWTHDLRPDSRLYKRWFDFPELEKRGWAIIFRIFDPEVEDAKHFESFAGWVPPERVGDADRWIALLNAEIRKRFD